MKSDELSPLEVAIIDVFCMQHGDHGFPTPDRVRVIRRENTGAGRYVDVESDNVVKLDDGYVDLGGKFIQMDGVPHGMMAVAQIKDHRLRQIEIAVYGSFSWDGNENSWSIVSPTA